MPSLDYKMLEKIFVANYYTVVSSLYVDSEDDSQK